MSQITEQIKAAIEKEAEELYPEPSRGDFLADRNLLYHLRESYIEGAMKYAGMLEQVWDAGQASILKAGTGGVEEIAKRLHKERQQFIQSLFNKEQ